MATAKDNRSSICTIDTAKGKIMVPYVLRRSRRSRHLRLSINGTNYVLLIVPWRVSEAEALKFLQSQGDWLRKHIGKISKFTSLWDYLQKRPYLSAHGQRLPLTFGFTEKKPKLNYDPNAIRVYLRFDPTQPIEPQIVKLLKRFGKEVIKNRTLCLAKRLKIKVGRVSVRDQVNCWGSCSERHTISLNWRLILLSPELHDYIIYHELAHLNYLNHSENYWKLLRRYDAKATRHDIRISHFSEEIMQLGHS